MTTDELLAEGVARAVKERMTPMAFSRMRETYKKRFSNFKDTLEQHGLKLVHN